MLGAGELFFLTKQPILNLCTICANSLAREHIFLADYGFVVQTEIRPLVTDET